MKTELVFLEPNRINAIDYMTADEIEKITKKQFQIGALIELGMDYTQIKGVILDKQLILPMKNTKIETA